MLFPLKNEHGVSKVALHGDHNGKTLKYVDTLLAVENLDGFTSDAYKEFAWKAFEHKVWGAVIAEAASEFHKFCDNWATEGIEMWEWQGDRLGTAFTKCATN